MGKQKTYTPQFKAKVVKELIEGDDSVSVVASRYKLNANMLSTWRKELFDNAYVIYDQKNKIKKEKMQDEQHREEVDNLNRIIGKLTVERDYLKRFCDTIK